VDDEELATLRVLIIQLHQVCARSFGEFERGQRVFQNDLIVAAMPLTASRVSIYPAATSAAASGQPNAGGPAEAAKNRQRVIDSGHSPADINRQ
jgi:hypothetical protein